MQASSLISKTDVAATAVLAQAGACVLTAARLHQGSPAADAYLQIFDAAAASDVTVGTTVPAWVVMMDSGTGSVSGGDGLPSSGLAFRLGIVVACTTTPTGNTGSTSQVRLGIL